MPKMKKKSFIQKNGLIGVWAMAGFIAMGYIGFLVTGTGDSSRLDIADKGGPVATQVASLKAHVDQLEKKIDKLKQGAAGPSTTAALPEKTVAAPVSGYGIDEQVDLTPAPVAAKRSADGPVSVKVLPLTEEDAVESLFDSNSKNAYGLDFVSAKSPELLERHWDYIRRNNPELVEGLQPRYKRRSSGAQPLYTLIVGPFKRMSAAQSRCKKLMLRSPEVECRATQFDTEFPTQFQAASHLQATPK